MSTVQSTQPGTGQQPPVGLSLNLASNNPFRNHTTSPITDTISSKTPTSPFDDPIPARPVSRNPFLDPFASQPSQPLRSPGVMSTQSDKGPEPTAEELFDTLALEDKKPVASGEGRRPPNRGPGPHGPPRGGPPGGRGRGGIDHRPTRSQEEAMRARRAQGAPPRPGGPATSPQRRTERRPRRNSDSSLLEIEKPLTEEEKNAKEARRKERERRHREGGKDKPRQGRKLDIIDQLDATSIFGTGAFHHDGPFDACNPHRNRKGSRRAPMSAFAKDSLNNSIGGSGPLKKRADHSAFMGNAEEEAFKDYSKGGVGNKIKNGYNFPNQSRGELPLFDPMSRGAILHGDESMGLGTSTFLEGTPAARTAIQRRQAEQAQEVVEGGLQRKKSLAQRIRSINRGPHPSGRITNPEGVYASRSPDPMPPATTVAAVGKTGERNPFFAEYNNEPETLTVKKNNSGDSSKNPTSPVTRPRQVSGGLGLERRATTDATMSSPEDGQGRTGRGLLGRVKSLKGGRKARNVSGDAPIPPIAPGTAV